MLPQYPLAVLPLVFLHIKVNQNVWGQLWVKLLRHSGAAQINHIQRHNNKVKIYLRYVHLPALLLVQSSTAPQLNTGFTFSSMCYLISHTSLMQFDMTFPSAKTTTVPKHVLIFCTSYTLCHGYFLTNILQWYKTIYPGSYLNLTLFSPTLQVPITE